MRYKTHPSSVRHVGSPLGDGSVGGERARWGGHNGGDESKDSDELHGEYDREEVVEKEEGCVLLECEETQVRTGAVVLELTWGPLYTCWSVKSRVPDAIKQYGYSDGHRLKLGSLWS